MDSKVQDYVKELIGTPYVWWLEGSTLGERAPFWATNDSAPSTAEVRLQGCNCAGFINLLRRVKGLPLPGVAEGLYYAAGVPSWFEYLEGVLEPFDSTRSYPAGTMLLRRFRDTEDQGHVAVLLSGGPVLEQKLAHSYISNGIAIDDTVASSHNWIDGGYYEYVCLPIHWIT